VNEGLQLEKYNKMTTLENNAQGPSPSTLDSAIAREVVIKRLKSIKEGQKDKAPWINKPKNLNEKLVLRFFAYESKEGFAPDKFTKPTPENPYPKRPIVTFWVQTEDEYWKRIDLNPGEGAEVIEKCLRNEDLSALLELERVVSTDRSGTKVNFTEIKKK
jgi:hypothetical protein